MGALAANHTLVKENKIDIRELLEDWVSKFVKYIFSNVVIVSVYLFRRNTYFLGPHWLSIKYTVPLLP